MNQGLFKGKVVTQIHYLDPIPYEDYKDMKDTEIAEMVKSKIQERIDLINSGKFEGTPSKILGKIKK